MPETICETIVSPGAARQVKTRRRTKPPAMLTRAELRRRVARVLEAPLPDADLVVETIIDSLIRGLRDEGRIEVRGFGVFWLHQRAARIGRNPKTGDSVMVPPKKVVHFKPSKEIAKVLIGA